MAPVDVSVVIPCHDRGAKVTGLLEALQRQTIGSDRFEVIVVDDGSPVPLRLDSAALRLRVLRHTQTQGPGAARNSGWRAASGSLVAFIDDDCLPDDRWLEALLRTSDGSLAVVQGKVAPRPDQLEQRRPLSHTIEIAGPSRLFVTANIAYPRSLLARLGGFDERFKRAGEDAELGARATKAGAVVRFAPDALVYHEIRDLSLVEHIRHTLKWTDGVRALALHPELRSLLILGVFWKPTHPWLIAGISALATRRPRVAVIALAPYLLHYVRAYRGDVEGLAKALPRHLVIDVAEVATAIGGSIRHGTLML